jgi:membrane protease YdiL (CAAX protease family)
VSVPSVLFGLWHALPSVDLEEANDAVGEIVGDTDPAVTALLAASSMNAAGGLLQAIRTVGRHVAAPAMVHATTNILGFSIAWWLRDRPCGPAAVQPCSREAGGASACRRRLSADRRAT